MTRPSRFPIYFSPEELGCLRATLTTELEKVKRQNAVEYERQLVGLLETVRSGIKEAFGRDL